MSAGLYRRQMTTEQKAAYVAKHGVEGFMALPEAPSRRFGHVNSMTDLVPESAKRAFIEENGIKAWDALAARANRPW